MPGWVPPWSAALLREEVLAIAHVETAGSISFETGQSKPSPQTIPGSPKQILKGLITQEEAERSPRRNIVTKALGVESSVDVELMEVPVKSGDMLLLCSDGLTRGVHPNDILSHPQWIGRPPHHVRSPHRHGERSRRRR